MTSKLARALAVALSVAAALAVTSVPASAAVNVTGRVVHVGDGDTVDVSINGNVQRIRMTGINTPELTRYSYDSRDLRGECGAVEATKRLRALIGGKTVRVTSRYASSMSGTRYRRTIWTYVDGAWRDAAEIMLYEGHGLWMPNNVEYLTNRATNIAARKAQLAGRGIWDVDRCGSGPYQGVPLRVRANWDAAGDDSANPNGEWIEVRNNGTVTVQLGGWRVRDSALRGYLGRGYVFPSGARVAPGRSVFVHPGRGANTGTHFYWNIGRPIFENASGYPMYMGDGGYLFDPQGDVRGWHQYPCRYAC